MNLIEIEIDLVVNSIKKVSTNKIYKTSCTKIKKQDLKNITKKEGWKFNWRKEWLIALKSELNKKTRIYKLTTVNNPRLIHGLISISIKEGFCFINLIESAPINVGSGKMFEGVGSNLIALACLLSLKEGFNGYVSFHAKTKLIAHYEKKIGTIHQGGSLMVIFPNRSRQLAKKFFNFTE